MSYSKLNDYIRSLKKSPQIGNQVVFHKIFKAEAAVFAQPMAPWPNPIQQIIKACGLSSLYRHQVKAVDLIRSGQNVVVATPTASGKTMTYNLPVLERVMQDELSRALYLFPLKALAQDQRKTLVRLAGTGEGLAPTAAIYDGDTSAWHRKKIRQAPPNILMTNPEMLHLSLLPYHQQWQAFFSHLQFVVIDEVHSYRGLLGANMACLFRRLHRVCEYYRARPTFVFCSATVGNPVDLAGQLTGLDVSAVTKSHAPQGQRHFLLMDPLNGPAQLAIQLLTAALHRRLRTIVYTQSRKLTELIAMWAQNRAGEFSKYISAYRAGLLPEERRDVESKLANGELLAVITTSALELGIDIGDLDLCLLVGYPGTIVSTWQRAGRVGRSGQESAMVLIAGEDALDQYFIHNPEQLFSQPPEAAVVNAENPEIISRHIPCAAAELPLKTSETYLASPAYQDTVSQLTNAGKLLCSADGSRYYAKLKQPHRNVDLRGSGKRFRILHRETRQQIGEIDGFRAFRETHPGAVYLHQGARYIIDTLDLETETATAIPAQVDYYTRVMGQKDTEILNIADTKALTGTRFHVGRLRVRDQVTGYERMRIRGNKVVGRVPLDLPPQVFETEGIWFTVSEVVRAAADRNKVHFMGGIHAIEHAAIGIFPLLVIADRNDLGGIAMPFHPDIESAVIFIYDAIPGGAGLSREAYLRAEDLLAYTHRAIRTCPCETGCPACVHSPKCGSGNRPIDKAAALFLLAKITTKVLCSPTGKQNVVNIERKPSLPERPSLRRTALPQRFASRAKHGRTVVRIPERCPKAKPVLHYGVFDLETQRSAAEVGGWHRADRMRVSCGVVYDSKDDHFHVYRDSEVMELINHLKRFEVVVGFNVKRFDYQVLSGYSDFDFTRFKTLDLLEKVHLQLGYRLSLDRLASSTLGVQKSGNGLLALKWWKEGKMDDIIRYCKKDVEITRDLYVYGKDNQYLLFMNKAGQVVRVPVRW